LTDKTNRYIEKIKFITAHFSFVLVNLLSLKSTAIWYALTHKLVHVAIETNIVDAEVRQRVAFLRIKAQLKI